MFGYASVGYRFALLARGRTLTAVTLPAGGWGWYRVTYTGSDLSQADVDGLSLRLDNAAGYSELYAAYVTLTLRPSACGNQESDVNYELGAFDALNWPSACWRAFSDASVFNRRLPSNPPLMANSAAIVDRMETDFGVVQHLSTNGVDTGGGIPIYWSQADDPWYTLVHNPTQARNPGPDNFVDRRIQLPNEALPSTRYDHHLTVIDQDSGQFYDFWDVSQKDVGGGEIHFGGGGQGDIRGSGLEGGAVAAQWGSVAGKIRGEELRRGRSDHALVLSVQCVNGNVVYPAQGQAAVCSVLGKSNINTPPIGALVTIDITDEEIKELTGPPSVKGLFAAVGGHGVMGGVRRG